MTAAPQLDHVTPATAFDPAARYVATARSPAGLPASVGDAALRLALDRLDAHDAHLLRLIYFEGMRVDEVADLLSERVPVVRLRVGRAMIELGRAILGDDEGNRS